MIHLHRTKRSTPALGTARPPARVPTVARGQGVTSDVCSFCFGRMFLLAGGRKPFTYTTYCVRLPCSWLRMRITSSASMCRRGLDFCISWRTRGPRGWWQFYGPAAQNITTRAAMKTFLTANDPGGAVPVSGLLHALARDAVKCWKCGALGHFARDCPNELGAGVLRGAGLNVLGQST